MKFYGGVYIYRCRKPGARLRIPILSWHFCYVGETTSFDHRHQQHTVGGGRYNAKAKDWSDRSPYVWARIPLPSWKWLLRSVETLAILLTWPVYNVAKNRWNPRRISPPTARRQRLARDRGMWWPNFQAAVPAATIAILVAAVVAWYFMGRSV